MSRPTKRATVIGAGAVAVLVAGAALGAASSGSGGAAPITFDGPGVRYSDPESPRTVRVPGTTIDLPAGSQERVRVADLRVARRVNGKVYLVGPGVRPGLVCVVALRESAPDGPAAIGCDAEDVAREKGIYLASDDPAGVDGGAYVGGGADHATVNGERVSAEGGIVPFRLPATGGQVTIGRENGGPPITFTVAGR